MVHSATHLLYRTRIEGCTCSNFQGYPCSKDWNEWCYYGNRKQIERNRWRRIFFWKFLVFCFQQKRYQTIPNDTVQKRYQTIPIKTIPNDTERYGTVSFFGEFKTICFFVSFKNDTDFLEKQRGEKWKTIPISTRNDTVISEKRYRFSTQTTPWKMKNDTPVSFGVVFSKVTIWDPDVFTF